MIVVPLITMLLTAIMTTWNFMAHGKQITCIEFGSHLELLSLDIQQSTIFLIEAIFVFHLHLVLNRVLEPNRQLAAAKDKDIRFKMRAYIILFICYTFGLLVIKRVMFHETPPEIGEELSGTELSFIILELFRGGFNVYILLMFLGQMKLFITEIKEKTSKTHVNLAIIAVLYVSSVVVLDMIFFHFVLPIYYI